ncbi:MAG: hypothetical protein B7Z55_16085, partial [Planctomycetales bacterium 12-60-4]
RNQLFMNNIHGARLNQDILTPQGSGYVGDGAPDFCFANDVWSQWIYLTYGPDSQVTMIDWYDKNQCHHRRDEGHDRTNGRIFKIVYGEYKPVKVDLAKLSDAELIDLQTNANEWYVRHSRRLLQERAAAGRLDAATGRQLQQRLTAAATTADRLRFLWALHAIQGLSETELLNLTRHTDADVRAWALQLGCESRQVSPQWLTRMAELAHSETAPTVRLALTSAVQRVPVEQRWLIAEGLVSHAEDANDHNLPLMAWYGVEPLVMVDPARAMQLATKSQIPLVSRFILRRAAAEDRGYDALFTLLGKSEAARRHEILEEVVAAFKVRADLKMPPAWKQTFDVLMKSDDPQVRQQAEFIAVKFGDERVLPALRETLRTRDLPIAQRQLALESLLVDKG